MIEDIDLRQSGSILHQRLLEAVLEACEVLLVVKLGMGDEPGRVVEDGDEVGCTPAAVARRERRPVHDVALPAVASEVEGEGPVVLPHGCPALVEAASPEEAVKR